MASITCITCGHSVKNPISDPFMCPDCERIMTGTLLAQKYEYMDNYQNS